MNEGIVRPSIDDYGLMKFGMLDREAWLQLRTLLLGAKTDR
jgi:hypothetical protein